jgi:hypothetical protein
MISRYKLLQHFNRITLRDGHCFHTGNSATIRAVRPRTSAKQVAKYRQLWHKLDGGEFLVEEMTL